MNQEKKSGLPPNSQGEEQQVRYYEQLSGSGMSGQQSGSGYRSPPYKKKNGTLKIVLVIVCIFIGILAISFSCNDIMRNALGIGFESNSGNQEKNIGEDHITVINIKGVISDANEGTFGASTTYDHQFTLKTIEEAMKNRSNKGIMLFVESPGGGVYESDEVYIKLKEYKEKTNRPVYTYMASMAASGGYYISAPSDAIYANRNCWTGSIGVTIGTFYDISGLLEKHGIKTVTITSGANKAMGSMTSPMTEEQMAIFQSLVDEAYDQFVAVVAEGRKMSVDQAKAIADGRIYTAKQAKEIGLVDKIATFNEAKSAMAKNEKLDNIHFVTVMPPKKDLISSLLSEFKPIRSGVETDLALMLDMMKNRGKMPILYMSEYFK